MQLKKFILVFSFLILNSAFLISCQCPLTTLSLKECDKYDIIFRGRIISDTLYDAKKGKAVFEVSELYKGVITDQFSVLFEYGGECAQVFNVGEEWIIYSNYKQAINAKMDWCSRSRKYFKNDKLDFYTVTYGNDYTTELDFLRQKLGLHKPLKPMENQTIGEPNILPNQTQFIVTLLISIVAMVLFYYLFNRFFKW
ncbi:MAG TPA: hypothetical protein VN026_08720 [Bacteroidia bacterium]|jgi:hypothetical protein|nr:hypothetical protein [Bacteroidia bacterium]